MHGISLLTMAMLGLLVAGAAAGSSPTAPPAAAAEASPVHLVVGRSPASDEEVEVVFQNVSADNVWIYLGTCFGRDFAPFQLGFTAKEGDRVKKGHFLDQANVGGRTEPYIVPLRAGSSYSLRIRFAHMIDDQGLGFPLFKPGVPRRPVLLTVEWDGRPPGYGTSNIDTYLPVWPGHLVSNSLSLGTRPD
jgi:hypothetical protein